jgi:hypothetical protein
VYYFDPNDASLLHGTVQSRTGVRKEILLARFYSTWRQASPSGILENGARIQRRSKPLLTMEIEIDIVYNMYRMRRFTPKSRMRRLLSLGPPNYAIHGTYKSGLDR